MTLSSAPIRSKSGSHEPPPSDAMGVINSKIDHFISLVAARDFKVVDELWTERGFRLVGSEKGEVFDTRESLLQKLTVIFTNPLQLIFDWPRREITVEGNIAWAFVEGNLIVRASDGEQQRAYNATLIFQHLDGLWRWRHFFGAEPY